MWLGCFMLLSGYLVPLELFPSWARTLTYALPFRYTLGFPVEILIGTSSAEELGHGLAVQWTYCAASCALALVVWRAGVRRFGAFGG